MPSFNLGKALDAGYEPKEILRYLAGRGYQSPYEGSDEDIIRQHLATQQKPLLPYEYADPTQDPRLTYAPAPPPIAAPLTLQGLSGPPPSVPGSVPQTGEQRRMSPAEIQSLGSEQGIQPTFVPMSLRDLAMLALSGPEQDAGVPLSLLAATRNPKGKQQVLSDLIKDWKWLPQRTVGKQLGLKELPKHVEPFGNFMQEQSAKAAAGELSPRDLIKAFTITRSSIQRGAVNADKVRKAGLNIANQGKIRPEGAFSEWLLTPEGKRYLDAAERGVVDEEAIQSAVNVMAPFGRHLTDIPDALRWAAQNLPGREKELAPIIARASEGAKQMKEWRQATDNLRGIGLAKQGFVGSLLGYGQLPTLDARQIKLHTGQPTSEAAPYLQRRGGLGGEQAVDRLAARQEAMDLAMPPEMQPYYQHLTHHAVWDKAANEATTHEDLIRAMKLAGIGGAIAAPLLYEYGSDQGYINSTTLRDLARQ